ncbi:hypothetical protein BMS3Abin17_01016 [archaeon BMS3Abin17]|nr:hypothetical protein BMS3Abin17_01016 [archaeon BMS3Abin17]
MFYTFSPKTPNINKRVVRIQIPTKIYKKIKNNFVKINVNGTELIDKITSEKRFVIPKEQKIIFSNQNIVKIEIIKNKKRKKKSFIVNKKIDILNWLPEKNREEVKINIIGNKDNLTCFIKNFKGRVRQVIIKKYVPLEFCRLLGYYQAEGGKEKIIKKRRGREVVITNTNLDLVKDFIFLSKYLIDASNWNAEIKLTKRNELKEKFIIKELIKLGVKKNKIKIRKEKKLKDFSIRLSICSTLLSDIILNFMNCIRKKLIERRPLGKNYKIMYINFMQGLFSGDGNYNTFKNKDGGTHHRLIFYEGNKNYAIDYQKLLRNEGIKSNIIKIKDKNLYIIRTTLNWELLLLLKELNLFDYHKKHKEALVSSIKSHKRYKSNKYLIKLGDNFNIKQICEVSNKSKVICYNWIKKMVNNNLIVKNKINDWSSSLGGKRIKGILKNLENKGTNPSH